MGHSPRSSSGSRSPSPSRSSRSKHKHERRDKDRDRDRDRDKDRRRRHRSKSRSKSRSPRRKSRFATRSPTPEPRMDRFGRSMVSRERARPSLERERERDGRSDDDRMKRIRDATETRLADEETKRKIETLVTQRVAEQVEVCRQEMEKEVQRRVEEAQRQMDSTLSEEMDTRMKVRTEEYEAKECLLRQERDTYRTRAAELLKEVDELQQTTADERLRLLEQKRRLEERVNALKREQEIAQKAVQDTILNKTGAVRKKFSMSLKK